MLFPDAALARRLELNEAQNLANNVRVRARRRPESGATVEPLDPSAWLMYAGAANPLTRCAALGWDGPVSPADLDRAEAFFRRRGVPARVDVCPLADPSLPQLLHRRGYGIQGFRHVFIRSCGGPPDPLPAGAGTGPGTAAHPAASPGPGLVPASPLTVYAVGADEYDTWAAAVSSGFTGRDDADPDEISENTPFCPGTSCYLARVDGEPAGGGALSVAGGLAALFSASTRPRFRRRGVQTALLAARLAAAAAGCDVATVQANPGSDSHRNIQRAGFQIAYTKMTMIREWDA